MKKLFLASSAVLVLLGAGCFTKPAPVPAVNEPVPQPTPTPTPEPAPPIAEDPKYGPSYKANFIMVDGLKVGDTVTSPLTVTGKARGSWYFEASFPVELVDANGKLVANGAAQAQGDWMTTQFVPFTITLTYPTPSTTTGTLILRKDNPSGLPANDDEMRIGVRFPAAVK